MGWKEPSLQGTHSLRAPLSPYTPAGSPHTVNPTATPTPPRLKAPVAPGPSPRRTWSGPQWDPASSLQGPQTPSPGLQ